MHSKLRFGILLGLIIFLAAGSLSAQPLSSQQIISLLNQDRERHGLSDLAVNPVLNLAAMDKAADMVSENYFAHTSPQGRNPWYWLKAEGYNYSYAGENLARGYNDAADLETSWMNSPTHRANILSPFYSDVGLAVVNVNDTNVVVQMFGSKDNKVTLRQ